VVIAVVLWILNITRLFQSVSKIHIGGCVTPEKAQQSRGHVRSRIIATQTVNVTTRRNNYA